MKDTMIPMGTKGVPLCVFCGEPVKEPRWNFKPDDVPGPLANKNNIHQTCRVRRAREEKARGK